MQRGVSLRDRPSSPNTNTSGRSPVSLSTRTSGRSPPGYLLEPRTTDPSLSLLNLCG
ncbi:hypothetical protein [Thermoleptolyngbya sp. C42_A2020_037]|uniref:hypothetical protein n=1 Tax=Thermoleptolyngbya sp. C42_A2020_037 TaxID=2747799 RepID=UPI0019FDE3E7|nr:hypothetical protein [Thermoleptolyngbya sp. C42_A2020_037]MBF2086417.1 hypothetical protein [Thermoleptolyngbya sp. C42_A2020_037]